MPPGRKVVDGLVAGFRLVGGVPVVLVLAAIVTMGLVTQHYLEKRFQKLFAAVRTSQEVTEQVLAWHRVRPVAGLRASTIAGTRIKTLDGPVDYTVDVAAATSLRGDRDGTLPKSRDGWPVPWPIVEGQPHVMPYYLALNAAAVAGKIREGSMAKDTPYVRQILDLIDKHTRRSGDGASFIYDFDINEFQGFVPKGWRSAFGDAAIVMTLCELFDVTRDANLLVLARKFAASLAWAGSSNDILYVDRAGYLWFEEYPKIAGRRTHVLNGHIFTIFALLRLSRLTNDRSYEPMIRAGLATAARFLPDSRNPGSTSSYNLGGDRVPDYGPARMILFAKTLAAITGHQVFIDAETALTTDE